MTAKAKPTSDELLTRFITAWQKLSPERRLELAAKVLRAAGVKVNPKIFRVSARKGAATRKAQATTAH